MDDRQQEIPGCDVLVKDNVISEVGPNLSSEGAEILDASGCVVIPGLVNTHNHIFETLYRTWPPILQVNSADWFGNFMGLLIKRPFPPEAAHSAATVNFGEMLLTGCTMSADHHWAWDTGQPPDFVDRMIDAAIDIGIRFHPSRGCMSMGKSAGGLVPDELAEPEDRVLDHAASLVAKYHDPSPFSMIRIVMAPSSIFTDSEAIYREMGALAKENPGVQCHTHLNEVIDDEFCVERYGIRPLDFMERIGWIGEEFLFYHVTTPNQDEVERLAQSRSFISICNAVDMRMGFGLAPLREFLDAGANVCFGMSGACANDYVDVIGDLRVALLANRLRFEDAERWISARELLAIATRAGAEGLGREDLGSIEPGKGADMAVFDLQRIDMAGYHDPVAALLYMGACHYTKATIVNGRIVAREGRLLAIDQEEETRKANEWARKLTAE